MKGMKMPKTKKQNKDKSLKRLSARERTVMMSIVKKV